MIKANILTKVHEDYIKGERNLKMYCALNNFKNNEF